MPAPVGKPIPDRVARRALSAFVVDPATGCHVSTYSTASHGYAQIGWTEKGVNTMTTAHRAAWVAVHGQIAEGMTIDHRPSCYRTCVNVEHLRELTNHENARRTGGRDWPVGECAHGHPNTELVLRGKKLVCRSCSREWQRRYRARKASGSTTQK